MAAAQSQEASSSMSRCSYHVFLSFRGEDTRKNFTDHLYTALVQAGFRTFRDDDEIQRGDNIELAIQKAIQESQLSIIVLSKDYASSRWCLDELVMIMERKKLVQHHVLPVFCYVDPCQVRKQTGSFVEAFVRHEERFKEEMSRVEGWRAARREVADLGGMVLQDGYESQFIQNIVKEVGNRVSRTILNVDPILVGIESRVELINLWFNDELDDVGIATIYGMGGIGKTTIAKIVYNMNFNKFEGSSFLANVREMSEQPNGLVHLQRKLLSDLLKRKADTIYNVDEGIIKIRKVVYCKRVLLILDDVDQLEQFNAIIGMKKWFCPGSKIVITTRHEHLLRAHKVNMLYKIKELDDKESLKLFSWHAFHQEHPVDGYEKHSKNVVHHCAGLPLALQVLGSSLFGKTTNVWVSALQKLERIADSKIQKILRISYDSLEDDHDQSLFIDIACFFIGMDMDYTVRILDGCNFYTAVGIQNLMDRCLVTIAKENKLMMHQLIRDMGREIVRQESCDNPGKRSRIWDNNDAFVVLSKNTGTESIRGLSLNMSTLLEDKHATTFITTNYAKRHLHEDSSDKLMPPHEGNWSKRRRLSFFSWKPVNDAPMNSLSTKAFFKMQNLKLLKLSYVKLNGSYEEFPKSLVWLRWHKFSMNFIPNDLCLEKLVVLDMRNSNLKNVWRGIKFLTELKILNLSHSHGLVETPNFIGLPRLERLVLKDCISLVQVDESIGDLQRLESLNLKGCRSLKKLPVKISMLRSLGELILSGCSNLAEFPEELRKLESLRVLHADGIAVSQLDPSKDLRKVGLSFWQSTFSWLLPRKHARSTNFSFAFFPSSLVSLSLVQCGLSDNAIPKDLGHLPSLQELNLTGNPFCCLPESIKSLTMLKLLNLSFCGKLQSLPELPTSLNTLYVSYCSSLERIRNNPIHLDSIFCEKLVEIGGLFKLEPLRNTNKQILNDLGLVNLELKPLENIEVEFFNGKAGVRIKNSIQVLYERDLCCIFLPGNEIPNWFSHHQNKGSSISFDVLPVVGHKINGLSFCVVYSCRVQGGYFGPGFGSMSFRTGLELVVGIKTKTEHRKVHCQPTIYGLPNDKEDMLWLGHWMIGNQLDGASQVQISVESHFFHIEECGVHLIYEQEEQGTQALLERYG